MTPGKIELQREKTWRLEQTKEDRCLTLARWCVGMNVDIVNVQSFFSHFQSCWALLLFSKQGGSRWKRYFCFRLLGWSANVTRLHWWWCQCRNLSNWLDDDVPGCTPNGQYTASMTRLRLCCIRVLLIEDFLLSISLKKMLTALDKRWTTAQEQAIPRHRRFLSKRSASFPEKKMGLELAEDL